MTSKSLVIQQLSSNFREAAQVVNLPIPKPGPNEVVIHNRYVGVNATDVNMSAGRYYGAAEKGLGFEGIGDIVSIGSGIENLKLGDSVVYFARGAYSEYIKASAPQLFPVPDIKPEYISLACSGLTASIGLEKAGQIKKGEKVLITAAAGALGQIVVQLCKAAGCYVIGLTSTSEKSLVLKNLGCDDIINYKEEDLDQVLSEKYPKGIDMIWETIGGSTFDTLMKHLATFGRLIVIGFISQYRKEEPTVSTTNIPLQVLIKSATVRGFVVSDYFADAREHFSKLLALYQAGNLKLLMDDGSGTDGGKFQGMEGCIRGVEYLHSGKSIGKVFVEISKCRDNIHPI